MRIVVYAAADAAEGRTVALIEWLQVRGHEVVGVVAAGARPSPEAWFHSGLMTTVELARRGEVDAVAVVELVDLGPTLIEQEAYRAELSRWGGKLVVQAPPPVDPSRDLLRRFDVERRRFSGAVTNLRLAEGLAAKVAAGGRGQGRAPYGADAIAGRLRRNAAEMAAVTRVLELRGAGMTYREIAAMMTAESYQTKSGGEWHSETVRRIVERHSGAAVADESDDSPEPVR